MSVQSMDQEVLTNIKRDNISVDKMMQLAPAIKDAKLLTRSEVISGLPGDTYEIEIILYGIWFMQRWMKYKYILVCYLMDLKWRLLQKERNGSSSQGSEFFKEILQN